MFIGDCDLIRFFAGAELGFWELPRCLAIIWPFNP